jgi:hypothetical protein
MDPGSQPQSPRVTGSPEAEVAARRLLAEFEQESLRNRSRLGEGRNRVLLRSIGILVLLLLGLGAAMVLLQTASALPDLLERSQSR